MMDNLFQIILFFVTLLTCIYILRKVRKSQIRIQDCVFWIYLPFVLLVVCFFPKLAVFAANVLGIGSTVNFVFLTVIFLLLLQLFLLSMKVSKLQNKLEELIQEYAIDKKTQEEKKDEDNRCNSSSL